MVADTTNKTKMELHIGKVDERRRVHVGSVGFKDGDVVVFLRYKNGIYLAKGDDILGRCVVNSNRIRLPKDVAKLLNISNGEHYAIIDGNLAFQKIESRLKLVKLVGIIDEMGNNYGKK